ncbi:MAG: ABC transporter ATP-binding protein [Chloroflexota bacterium]
MIGTGWFSFFMNDDRKLPKLRPGMLKRIWAISRSHWPLYLGLLASTVITSIAVVMPPILIMNLIDEAIPNRDVPRLHLLGFGLLAASLLITFGTVWTTFLKSRLSENIIFDLRRMLYKHMQHMSIRFFAETRTGELMSRLNSDVNGAQTAVTDTVMNFVSNIFSFGFAFIAIATIEWRVALLGIIILPLFIMPAKRVAAVLRGLRRQAMERIADMYAMQNEVLGVSGALLIKIFGQEKRQAEQFELNANRVREVGVKTAVIGQSFFSLLGLIGSLVIGIVYWAGGALVLNNELTIGTVVACATLLGQIYDPLMSLTNAPVEFAYSLVSFERVFEVLDLPIEIKEIPNAVSLPRVGGRVVFKNVSFDYSSTPEGNLSKLEDIARFDRFSDSPRPQPAKDGLEASESGNNLDTATVRDRRWALKNISFEIQPGQLVALVGPSGAGKTTLTHLIPRLYDPTQGQVFIDNLDIKNVTLPSLIRNIGIVTQETYLFNDSIRANLLFARLDATENEMIEAARAANIHEFITELPDGYDTMVGERGFRLSGGEKQRVAIARAILKDPQIIILDEATSHLDSLSESLIQDALLRVLRGRTSFVIAHRLSTILSSEVILVLKDGELLEQGTHHDLLAHEGLYAVLYRTQFQPLYARM